MAVAIARDELSAGELRAAARRSKDVAQARRLLALALVLEGASRTEAAEAAGMDRQTLCDWVHRYNEEGVEGLSDRQRPGRPSRLSEEQKAELAELVEQGPDVAVTGMVRWRCVDLQGEIKVVLPRFGGVVRSWDVIPELTLRPPVRGSRHYPFVRSVRRPSLCPGPPVSAAGARSGGQGRPPSWSRCAPLCCQVAP